MTYSIPNRLVNTVSDLYQSSCDDSLRPEALYTLATDALRVRDTLNSRLEMKQFIREGLDLLTDFSGSEQEYQLLAYRILLFVCEFVSDPAAEHPYRIDLDEFLSLKEILKQNRSAAKNAPEAYPPAIALMKEYIDKNYMEQIKISDLADVTGLSPNYAGKIFREHIGVNVSGYINRRRIAAACDLLLNTNLKIYQIALQVGYSESYYFSNIFKKLMNTTPIDYRKNPSAQALPKF